MSKIFLKSTAPVGADASVRPPQTNGMRPPQTNGMHPPQTNGMRPPQTNGMHPPQTNGMYPSPKTPIITINQLHNSCNQQICVELTDIGNIINQKWCNIPKIYNNVKIKEYVIMPNHIHGIIQICDNIDGGTGVVDGGTGVVGGRTGVVGGRTEASAPTKDNARI